MPSWQFQMIRILFYFRKILNKYNGQFDIEQERKETESLATNFKTKQPLDQTPVDINGVPAEWVQIRGIPAERVILFLHGGSYNSGSIHTHRSLAANISEAARARTLVVQYRLAPEHPFPAAVEDALAVYRWLGAEGIPPEQIVLTGDSCGGGLVLALLLKIKSVGEALPAAAVCLSPWTDLSCSGETWETNSSKDLILNPDRLRASARLYLGETDPHEPLASPLFGELHDFPPLLIQVGSDEILLSDSTCLAEKARQAGVDVFLEIWDSMPHEWHFAADFFPEARQAIDHIGEFIRKHS